MYTRKNLALLSFVFCSIFLLTSCIEKDVYVKVSKDQFFNFSLEQEVTLNVDYAFPQNDYIVLFGVYDQNPIEENEDGSFIKKDIDPIYQAATDGKGKFNDKIVIASALSEVWLYSEYLGTLSPVRLDITNNTIAFNQKEYVSSRQTRAAEDENKYTYPDGWLTLGNWSEYGTPHYLLPDLQMPPASTLYTINKIFVAHSNVPLQKRYEELFTGQPSSDVKIIKPTKVNLTFINSTASWKNAVGYFTYKTDEPPTNVNQITPILAFPSATPYIRVTNNTNIKGALLSGQQVQLKYWDGSRFHEEFPAGISIGWFLQGNSFQNGNIKPQGHAPCRYSLSQLNSDNVQRTVSLRDRNTDRIVAIGFEDNTDSRYNDATFYLGVEEGGAIDPSTPSLPDVGNTPSDEENYTTYFGTLAYEDLWTAMGDYDMNDVMIDYTCKVYKHIIGNNVYKLVDEFIPRHKGGSLQSGFGYQFHKIPSDYVRKVTIEADGVASRYMEGQMLEPGQSHPTIILFDESSEMIGKKIKVTVELSDVDSKLITPPYNPFIFTHSEEGRTKEVHLPMYPPTDKADLSLFGTGRDGSRPLEEMFYVTAVWSNQYPYALNMVNIKDFPIPEEKKRIDVAYPKFKSWVESKGEKDRNWYKFPAK